MGRVNLLGGGGVGVFGTADIRGGGVVKIKCLQILDLWRLASLMLCSVLSMKFVSLIIYMGKGTKDDVT